MDWFSKFWDFVCAVFWSTVGSCMFLPVLLGSYEKHMERHLAAGLFIAICFQLWAREQYAKKGKTPKADSPGDRWRGSNDEAGGYDGGSDGGGGG